MKSDDITYSAITAEPVESAETTVEVIAPATLQAGYVFNATYEGTIFRVDVPDGGVIKGQKLIVPFTPTKNDGASSSMGAWKDDIFACSRYGICHPSLIFACCCPLVLMGQVMTRLKLDWFARSAPAGEWTKTFSTLVYITIAYIVLTIIFSPADPEEEPGPFYNLFSFLYGVLSLVLITKVRGVVRARHQIPETRCIGCEDFCCAFWCGCCTVSQLARETTDYDTQEARYFTNDGLPPDPTTVMIV